jgi:hypothetical protein
VARSEQNVLVVGGNPPRGSAALSARQRGLEAFFARDYREAVLLLAELPFVACAVMPGAASFDLWAVAALIRQRAPGLPIAIVTGPSRIDDSARVVWTAVDVMSHRARAAIADIASQACLEWITKTWDENDPTVEVEVGRER